MALGLSVPRSPRWSMIIMNWIPLAFPSKTLHDDVIKWKHFPRNWPFVRKIHRSPVNFPHKGQWRGALMFSLIYVWINDWANNREAGDLRRQHGHYDVIVMVFSPSFRWSGPWCGTRHGLPLWLAGLNMDWHYLSRNGLWAHMTGGNFHHLLQPTDSSVTYRSSDR